MHRTEDMSVCSRPSQGSVPTECVFSAETWRRTLCLETTSPQTAGCLGPTGSAPRRLRVLSTQRLMGKQKCIRSSTGRTRACAWRRGRVRPSASPLICLCSFLCLVPDEAKSSYQVEGTGYDTYLRDAHRQVRGWSITTNTPEVTSEDM